MPGRILAKLMKPGVFSISIFENVGPLQLTGKFYLNAINFASVLP
jgi:hypothetical protein